MMERIKIRPVTRYTQDIKRLYEECTKEHIDFAEVEALLKQGADPLGPMQGGEWNELEHVYGEIVSETDKFWSLCKSKTASKSTPSIPGIASISCIIIVGIMAGSVMCQILVNLPAPSISAAS